MPLLNKRYQPTLLLLLAVTIGACQQTPDPDQKPLAYDQSSQAGSPHDPHHNHDHIDHNHDHGSMDMIDYQCSADKIIHAHYDTPSHDLHSSGSVHLLIDGIEYDLTPIKIDSNDNKISSYQSKIGIDDDSGLIWQFQDNQATLSKIPTDAMINAHRIKDSKADWQTLFSCHPAPVD